MEQEQKANGKPSAGAYAELRKLLVGPEQETLHTLEERLVKPEARAEDVSEVLPAAIRLRAAKDGLLQAAMRPLVEEAFRVSIEKDPNVLGDVLTPLVGAAVRRAIAQASRSLIRKLNQSVEHSISLRALKWRMEAARTGKTYAEIMLARSVLYRVEQVFLIHKKTGALLQQRVADTMVIRDAELVSTMLKSIQEFVRGSYGAHPTDELEMLRVGEFEVWIQYGPFAILAAVIRGTPPKQLQPVFARVLDQIGKRKSTELRRFDGDTSRFLSCQDDLKACFLGQGTDEPPRLSAFWWVAGAAALAGLIFWLVVSVRDSRRMDNYMARLRTQPGIVATGVEKRGGRYLITGLRDPLSENPAALLPGSGMDPAKVQFRWELYHSLQPEFEAARRLNNQRMEIEAEAIHFTPESYLLPLQETGAVELVARQILTLMDTARTMGKGARIEIVGNPDRTGNDQLNRNLAMSRASEVRTALVTAGVPPTQLSIRAAEQSEPARGADRANRTGFVRGASFRIALDSL